MLVQSNPSERHVWVANVGLRGFSGAHIVDLILTNEKKMKYVAGMANCFDGQWIVLREIRNVRTAAIDGRCRCAIQLDAIRYSFEDHPELFKEEWGWSDAHAEGAEEREENKHHAAVSKY